MKKFYIICLIFLALLCGCKDHLQIEQNISYQYNYQNDGKDYLISTKVWVLDWKNSPKSLPYLEATYASTFDVDIIKELEFQKAKAIEKRIGKKYEMLSREE